MLLILLMLAFFLLGAACGLLTSRRLSFVLSAVIAWLAFLGFNLYADRFSPDRELMKGSVWFFQFTLGTLTTLAAVAGTLVVRRLRAARAT